MDITQLFTLGTLEYGIEDDSIELFDLFSLPLWVLLPPETCLHMSDELAQPVKIAMLPVAWEVGQIVAHDALVLLVSWRVIPVELWHTVLLVVFGSQELSHRAVVEPVTSPVAGIVLGDLDHVV